jgi:hypothetical protein
MSYWNFYKHKVELVNNKIIIDDKYSLICFHYQGFKPLPQNNFGGFNLSSHVMRFLYEEYYKKLSIL